MHRLLVDTDQLMHDQPSLSREAVNHLKVLRPRDSEAVELFDGHGHSRVYRYDLRTKALRCPVDAVVTTSPPLSLTLFACVTKGSRWDWTIEKATELGVTRIMPVISARTIVRIAETERTAKRDRWMRIAEDAARQSDAKWLPEICEPINFVDVLASVRETSCFVGALTNPPPKAIGECLFALSKHMQGKPAAVFVGPEGDFTPEELAALIEVATPVSFGSTILRAETAAIYGISVLKSYLDTQPGGRS